MMGRLKNRKLKVELQIGGESKLKLELQTEHTSGRIEDGE